MPHCEAALCGVAGSFLFFDTAIVIDTAFAIQNFTRGANFPSAESVGAKDTTRGAKVAALQAEISLFGGVHQPGAESVKIYLNSW